MLIDIRDFGSTRRKFQSASIRSTENRSDSLHGAMQVLAEKGLVTLSEMFPGRIFFYLSFRPRDSVGARVATLLDCAREFPPDVVLEIDDGRGIETKFGQRCAMAYVRNWELSLNPERVADVLRDPLLTLAVLGSTFHADRRSFVDFLAGADTQKLMLGAATESRREQLWVFIGSTIMWMPCPPGEETTCLDLLRDALIGDRPAKTFVQAVLPEVNPLFPGLSEIGRLAKLT
jgi:hypothetical protein